MGSKRRSSLWNYHARRKTNRNSPRKKIFPAFHKHSKSLVSLHRNSDADHKQHSAKSRIFPFTRVQKVEEVSSTLRIIIHGFSKRKKCESKTTRTRVAAAEERNQTKYLCRLFASERMMKFRYALCLKGWQSFLRKHHRRETTQKSFCCEEFFRQQLSSLWTLFWRKFSSF